MYRDYAKMMAAVEELQSLPGVGPSIARDLYDLGYRNANDIAGEDPEAMYAKTCRKQGCKVDRGLVYVYRFVVYYSSNSEHDPELLQWWHWKDNGLAFTRRQNPGSASQE